LCRKGRKLSGASAFPHSCVSQILALDDVSVSISVSYDISREREPQSTIQVGAISNSMLAAGDASSVGHPEPVGVGHLRRNFGVLALKIFLNFFAPISRVKRVDMTPSFSYTCAVVQGPLCLVVKGKSSAPEHRMTERGCWKSGRNGAPAPQSRVKPLRCKQMQFTPRGEASLRST
jgi:hypothetical protein